jgi:5-methyltetrahydropteroyltriglutamate--homocysteine methyltransferase
MANRILTTHVGSLPRPAKLIELNNQRIIGEQVDEVVFGKELDGAVVDVVRRQKEAGIDLVNDGEFGHTMGFDYDYGAWLSYVIRRLNGVEAVPIALWDRPMSTRNVGATPGEFVLGSFKDRRDWNKFREAYADPRSGCALPEQFMSHYSPLVRGPISYKGQEALQRDIANLKGGLAAAGIEEGGWMNSVAPASCSRFTNEYYKTDDELLYACADAMREEYKAIIDAGLILQLDDPVIAASWDQAKDEPSVEGYRRYTMTRIDALNHSVRGYPPTASDSTFAGGVGTAPIPPTSQ